MRDDAVLGRALPLDRGLGPKEWLKKQSELLYFTGIKNSEFAIKCALTKVVITSMLIHLSFV